MPRYIIRLDDAGTSYYLEWSTIVDAPVTTGGTLAEFADYYRWQYGEEGMRGFPERMARADGKGTSSLVDDGLDDLIGCNRAGEDETCLTREQIVDHYVRGNPLATGTRPGEEEPAYAPD